ncbi:hypothetical protein OAB00_04120, partial [Akkermansiaceae bacterium]|nr:hypothetical protein [Akkermansiaceae bacterium]
MFKKDTTESLNLIQGVTRSQLAKEEVQVIEIDTNADTGKALSAIKIENEGSYLLQIEGSDSNGKQVSRELHFNAIGKDTGGKLTIIRDNKAIYDDEDAKFQLFSNLSESTKALMTIETDKIIKYSLIDVSPGVNELSIPLASSYAPLFRCSIMAIDEREFYATQDMIEVKKKLTIESSIQGLTQDEDGKTNAKAGSNLKALVEVKDSRGIVTPAVLFTALNPSQLSKLEELPSDSIYTPFIRSAALSNYASSTSCGFDFVGKQTEIAAAIIEENKSELMKSLAIRSVQRPLTTVANSPRSPRKTLSFYSESIAESDVMPNILGDLLIMDESSLSLDFGASDGFGTGFGDSRGNDDYFLGNINGKDSDTSLLNQLEKSKDNAYALSAIGSSSLPVWSNTQVLTTGKQEIEIPLPNTAGTWLLDLNAVGGKGRMGKAQHLINTTSDYSVLFENNGFVLEGDSFTPTLKVFRENTESAEEMTLELIVSDKGQEIVSNQTVKFAKGKSTAQLVLQEMIARIGEPIAFKVTNADKSIEKSHTIPVKPWGAAITMSKSAEITAGTAEFIKLSIPADATPTELSIKLIPQFDKFIIDLATSSTPYISFGCIHPLEDTHPAGRLLALTSALTYLESVKATNSDDYKNLTKLAKWSFDELTASMNPKGYWSSGEGTQFQSYQHTAIAYRAMQQWKKLSGEKAQDESTIEVWLQTNYSNVPKADNDTRCLIQMALSYGGKADFSTCNRLFRDKANLSTAGQILLATAFNQLERKSFAETIMNDVAKKSVTDWDSKSSVVFGQPSFLLGAALDVTADLNINPETRKLWRKTLIEKASNGVTNNIVRGTAVAGLAASQSIVDGDKLIVSKGNGEVYVDGKLNFSFSLDDPDTLQPKRITSDLQPNSEIKIKFNGQSKVYASATVFAHTNGFSEHKVNNSQFDRVGVSKREYFHQSPEYKGNSINVDGTSAATNVELENEITVRFIAVNKQPKSGASKIIESIPAGFVYVK